ncbi:hypothetical protein [Acidiphilium sp.]|uniref:hypothetical protein n=1 Tax=Acidiphilium sp. TaxID=527 RepID=UPI003D041579
MTPSRLIALAGAIVATSCGLAPVASAGATTQFSLSGLIATPGVYTRTTLNALPGTTKTATYRAASGPVTDTYTGPTLWTLLSAAGGVITDPAIKNDALRDYVIVKGSDGYSAAVSLGEIDPKFGNQTDLIADADTAGQLGTNGDDGFARLVVPGDAAGGRYVSNIASIQVQSAPTIPVSGAGGVSSSLTVTGAIRTPAAFSLANLQAMAATTETATYLAGKTPVTDTYTGVSLWTLINGLGLVTQSTPKNDILNDIVVATGSDGYAAVFSMGEIDPAFGNQPDLVAYADTAGQLGSGGADGFARLVVPGDAAGGRYVSNLVNLDVIDTSTLATNVPEPASLILLLGPVLGLAVIRRVRPPLFRAICD